MRKCEISKFDHYRDSDITENALKSDLFIAQIRPTAQNDRKSTQFAMITLNLRFNQEPLCESLRNIGDIIQHIFLNF